MSLHDDMTMGELYDPAVCVTTVDEATDYLNRLITRRLRTDVMLSRDLARKIEMSNISNYTQLIDPDSINAISALYGITDPIFTDSDRIDLKRWYMEKDE